MVTKFIKSAMASLVVMHSPGYVAEMCEVEAVRLRGRLMAVVGTSRQHGESPLHLQTAGEAANPRERQGGVPRYSTTTHSTQDPDAGMFSSLTGTTSGRGRRPGAPENHGNFLGHGSARSDSRAPGQGFPAPPATPTSTSSTLFALTRPLRRGEQKARPAPYAGGAVTPATGSRPPHGRRAPPPPSTANSTPIPARRRQSAGPYTLQAPYA